MCVCGAVVAEASTHGIEASTHGIVVAEASTLSRSPLQKRCRRCSEITQASTAISSRSPGSTSHSRCDRC